MEVAVQNAVRHLDFWVTSAQAGKFGEGKLAILCSQPLVAAFSFLRCIETEPDSPHLLARGPESGKIPQVVRALELLPCYRAVNVDAVS